MARKLLTPLLLAAAPLRGLHPLDGKKYSVNAMTRLAAASLLALAATAQAGVVTSFADPALTGASVDNFSSYAVGTPASLGNGYTLTQNGGGTLEVTDGYNGYYGAVGRSVITWSGAGVTFNFDQAVSAFAVLIGGADYDWKVEVFDGLGVSMGSSTIVHNVNGFVAGWAGAGIKSAKFVPTSGDAVLFDKLNVVTNTVPEPAALSLIAIALLGAAAIRKRRASQA